MNAEVEEVKGKYKISFTHKSVVEIKAEHFSQLESQEVYCLQVPSTFLYVKHRDETSSPMVTGNCIHAKSYSNIFMTLASTEQINNVFRWAEDNELLQEKAHTIVDFYKEDDPYITTGNIRFHSSIAGGGTIFNDGCQMFEDTLYFIVDWRKRNEKQGRNFNRSV